MGIVRKKFGNQEFEAVYKVEETEHNMRLDQFLQLYLKSFSRESVKEKIKMGDIEIIGRPGKHRPNSKVHFGDQVLMKIKRTVHEDEYWRGKKLDLIETPDIVFEDDDLIVISKPPYMAAHPTGKHLFNCATVYFEKIHNKTIHSIHRLDRETSGIMLLGKNPKASNAVTELFEKNQVRKCYFFIAINKGFNNENYFEANERLGTLETGLKRVYINNFPESSSDGKSAKTNFSILHKSDDYVLGLAFPKTGRQHQIRVHAMINKLPLLGDKLYLGSFEMFQRFKDNIALEDDHNLMQIPRHALHAIAINLDYKKKTTTFKTEIPTDLKKWLMDNLELDLTNLNQKIEREIEIYFKTSLR